MAATPGRFALGTPRKARPTSLERRQCPPVTTGVGVVAQTGGGVDDGTTTTTVLMMLVKSQGGGALFHQPRRRHLRAGAVRIVGKKPLDGRHTRASDPSRSSSRSTDLPRRRWFVSGVRRGCRDRCGGLVQVMCAFCFVRIIIFWPYRKLAHTVRGRSIMV